MNVMIVIVVGIIIVGIVPMARVLIWFPEEWSDLLVFQFFFVPVRVFNLIKFVASIVIYYSS